MNESLCVGTTTSKREYIVAIVEFIGSSENELVTVYGKICRTSNDKP